MKVMQYTHSSIITRKNKGLFTTSSLCGQRGTLVRKAIGRTCNARCGCNAAERATVAGGTKWPGTWWRQRGILRWCWGWPCRTSKEATKKDGQNGIYCSIHNSNTIMCKQKPCKVRKPTQPCPLRSRNGYGKHDPRQQNMARKKMRQWQRS